MTPRYDLRRGTDEEKNYVKKIKGELAEILEAPHVLSKLKGDDLQMADDVHRVTALGASFLVQGELKEDGNE